MGVTGRAGSARVARVGGRLTQALAIIVAGYTLAEAFVLVRARIDYGMDYRLYMERAQSWLAGDGFYLAGQLSGPYPITHGEAMYPPVTLWLLVPFTRLPAILWWAIPALILAAALWRIRPTTWGWLVLLITAVYGRDLTAWTLGNPSIWAFAAVAAGLAWKWPAPLVALKPTLGPFALVGIRRRAWWIGAAIGLALCLPFRSMWFDYLTAMENARQTAQFGFAYLFGEWPIAAALVVVGTWGRTRTGRSSPGS